MALAETMAHTLNLQTVKSDRLYMKVAEQLRSLIENEQIKPGQRFPSERELAEQLGVSRPTIREAMIALELSGVIEIRTGSGIYVTQQKQQVERELSDKGIGLFEIMEIRYIIEAEACALAASRITEEQLKRLRGALQAMQEEEKRPDASEKADCEFHLIIAEAAQNSAILEVVKWLWDLRNQSELSTRLLATIRKEGVHPSIDEHRKILQALEQRNPEKARIAMKMHIENATDNAAMHFER